MGGHVFVRPDAPCAGQLGFLDGPWLSTRSSKSIQVLLPQGEVEGNRSVDCELRTDYMESRIFWILFGVVWHLEIIRSLFAQCYSVAQDGRARSIFGSGYVALLHSYWLHQRLSSTASLSDHAT